MSVPMFTSGPPPLYPGDGWEAKLPVDGIEVWCPVILIDPTAESAIVLVALNGSSPRWFKNVEVRRKP